MLYRAVLALGIDGAGVARKGGAAIAWDFAVEQAEVLAEELLGKLSESEDSEGRGFVIVYRGLLNLTRSGLDTAGVEQNRRHELLLFDQFGGRKN